MKIFIKLSLIFSVFLITFFGEIAINLACGGEIDPYDYYISYFHNNIQGDDYSPFAYNEMVLLNTDTDVESEPDINSAEWAKYLNAKKADVIQGMYGTDSATNAALAHLDINTTSLPDSTQKNSFIQALNKHKNALKYYLFAKSCEPYADVAFDLWDPKPRDTVAMSEKAQEGLKLTETEKDGFLKLRYAYQAQRMFHYAGLHAESRSTYEQYIKFSKVNSAVKGWAMALYAGSVRRLGNPDEAAFLFSKVFASNPERRIMAYKNYYYTSSPIEGALKYAKTNNEKANIWAINGFGNPESGIESLHKVYEYEPKSLMNGTLLVREVNKLEQNLIKASDIARIGYNYYFSENENQGGQDSSKLEQLNEIRNFAVKLASEKKYPQPELGTLTAAYLSWMENKDSLASNYLATLKPEKLPKRLQDQYRIVDLLIKAKNIKKGNPFNENDLLPTLKWLDEKRFAESENNPGGDDYGQSEHRFTRTTRNFYQQILVPAYINMGDTAKAALAMVKSDLNERTLRETSLFRNMSYLSISFWQDYLSPISMKALAIYKTRSGEKNLTGLLSSALNQLSDNDFYELYGTTYLRTHQYDQAVKMFAKISKADYYFGKINYRDENSSDSDPFIETINDYPIKYTTKSSLTKKTFAAKMLRLQKLIVSDKKNAALYYYKMATAVYQTGYYGNSWLLINYSWSAYDNNRPVKYVYDGDYKEAKTAKAWYLKARALSTNANFKAKCTFMLAKCKQKEIIIDSGLDAFGYYNSDDSGYQAFLQENYDNPYFKELKRKYRKTPFYAIAAGECSYLRDFIKTKK